MGLGHRRRQLRDLQEPHHGPLHRVPGEPGQRGERRVHGRMGCLQPRLPLPLHQPLAQDAPSLPTRQPRMGAAEVRQVDDALACPPFALHPASIQLRDDTPPLLPILPLACNRSPRLPAARLVSIALTLSLSVRTHRIRSSPSLSLVHLVVHCPLPSPI